ncbi:MAG TPA: ATP-binding protein [Candidatus Polarisedimenticolia bacterium]|jgi:DNA replication protein DnaC
MGTPNASEGPGIRPGASTPSTDIRGSGACPQCGGTGFELIESADGVARARRCACLGADRVERLLRESRIPRRYQSCSFEEFADLNTSLSLAKLHIRRFVEEYPIHDSGLLLMGPCGVGKTHLAAAALLSLMKDKGARALFYDFRDLLKEIQASYNAVSGTTELEVLQPIFGAEVLVLDDLGSTRMTDWVRDTLSHIINNRYNERRVTIFTSNLDDEIGARSHPADERVREKPNLRSQIGDALRSRLYEMCEVITLEGEDFRRTVHHTGRRPAPLP